jgi:hypothetical protein
LVLIKLEALDHKVLRALPALLEQLVRLVQQEPPVQRAQLVRLVQLALHLL